MSTPRKIDLMYKLFGYGDGLCKECNHYKKLRYHDKNYRKCEVYGVTNSKATDWRGTNPACGLFPDKPYKGDREIVYTTEKRTKEEEQIPGQMSLF